MPCKSCYFLHMKFMFIRFHFPSGFSKLKLIYFLNIYSHIHCNWIVESWSVRKIMWKQHVDAYNTYWGGGQTREKGIAKMLDTSVYHGSYWKNQKNLELVYWAYIKMNHNKSIGGVFFSLLPPQCVHETKLEKTFAPKLLENSWTHPALFILWWLYNSIYWPFKCSWVGMVKCHLLPLSHLPQMHLQRPTKDTATS
jgi:hypothetical protein